MISWHCGPLRAEIHCQWPCVAETSESDGEEADWLWTRLVGFMVPDLLKTPEEGH